MTSYDVADRDNVFGPGIVANNTISLIFSALIRAPIVQSIFAVQNFEDYVAHRQRTNIMMHITSLTEDYNGVCLTSYPKGALMLRDNHCVLTALSK